MFNRNEKIMVGLCAGRHEMPVSEYIFDEVEDVLDFKAISDRIFYFLRDRVGFSVTPGCGINQADYVDIEVFRGDKELVLYVTGLTSLTAEVIRLCALHGISLTLMHFNRETGEYVPQHIF